MVEFNKDITLEGMVLFIARQCADFSLATLNRSKSSPTGFMYLFAGIGFVHAIRTLIGFPCITTPHLVPSFQCNVFQQLWHICDE